MNSDYSVEKDVQALLQQGLEQTKMIQDMQTGRAHMLTVQEVADTLGELIAIQGKAILRLAREIDHLRGTVWEK